MCQFEFIWYIGMEYPFNVETALAVEKCIRENGAIPATIAIIKGRIKVLFVLIFYNFIFDYI